MNKPKIQKLIYDTAPLKAALVEYDQTAPDRARLWETVECNDDAHRAELADAAALEKVQEAFYEVTKDRNSRDVCRCVDIEFARRVATFEFQS